MPAGGLRARVAAQLDRMLGSADLDARGPRASVMIAANYRHGARTPAELASLVHLESVAFIDELRTDCLARGENVVIEGTLSWPPAAQHLLDELVQREYREVRIVDVEVPRVVAHEQALARWWAGRQDGIAGRGGGGRFVPAGAIDHAFTDPGNRRSVCAANVRAAFDSPPARALPVLTLTVYDSTGAAAITETQERRLGVLQPR